MVYVDETVNRAVANRDRRIARAIWTVNCWTHDGVRGATFYAPDFVHKFAAARSFLVEAGLPADLVSKEGVSEIPASELPDWIKDPTIPQDAMPQPFAAGREIIADGIW